MSRELRFSIKVYMVYFVIRVDYMFLRWAGELKQHIPEKPHNSKYSIHIGITNMYRELQEVFSWNNMKRNIAYFWAKCPNFPQVKVQQQKSGVMNQQINIPTWKWDVINMDYITCLPHTRIQPD